MIDHVLHKKEDCVLPPAWFFSIPVGQQAQNRVRFKYVIMFCSLPLNSTLCCLSGDRRGTLGQTRQAEQGSYGSIECISKVYRRIYPNFRGPTGIADEEV